MFKKRKILLRFIKAFLAIFVLINVVAFFHAYKFTHFSEEKGERTQTSSKLSSLKKIKTLLFGVNNPRPDNTTFPSKKFETVKIKSNKEIECWNIKVDNPLGTVILFHGYSGQKSTMLDKADSFLKLGYNTLLVDFMGSGGSAGNQTTIGFLESEQVKSCYEYLSLKGEKNIFLFGTSMGSVAIMKSLSDYDTIKPKGIILECPFGTMYETVCARFKTMNLPTFPMAGLLVFWGGIQNGFWAFGHNPIEYSKSITCPTLLMYGAKDKKVSKAEIDGIYANLNSNKVLKVYPQAGHENYLKKYKKEWLRDVTSFMSGETKTIFKKRSKENI